MTLRLIVFDVDGTLVDSQAHILASMAAAFDAIGRPMPPRHVALSVVGLSLPQALDRLMPDLDEASRARMVADYRTGYMAQAGAAPSPLFPGARETLDALHGDDATLLGVATGNSRRGLDRVMAQHDLAGYFVTAQVADDHPSKPHPSMLEATRRDTGAAPGVMIGDTSFDMEMGRAAGFRTVGVTWGYHDADRLRQAGAEVLVDDFAALVPTLEALR